MQTYLAVKDFDLNAQILSVKHLGRQRVDCKLISNAWFKTNAWSKHPAVRMWEGHALWFVRYYDAIVRAWLLRGYHHQMELNPQLYRLAETQCDAPWWLGEDAIYRSHRAVLIEKDPAYYGPLFDDFDVGAYGTDTPFFVYPVHIRNCKSRCLEYHTLVNDLPF